MNIDSLLKFFVPKDHSFFPLFEKSALNLLKATELLNKGETGTMVSLRGTKISSVPIKEAIGSLHLVLPDSEEVQTAKATGVSFGD